MIDSLYIMREVCVCVLEGSSSLSQDYLQLKEILHFTQVLVNGFLESTILSRGQEKDFNLQAVAFHALMHPLKACSLPVSRSVQFNQRFSKFLLSAGTVLGPERGHR